MHEHHDVLALVGQLAGHQLEEEHAQTPYVTLLSEGTAKHFWRHKWRRPSDTDAPLHGCCNRRGKRFLPVQGGGQTVAKELCQAEVREHGVSRFSQDFGKRQAGLPDKQDIVTLQVLMQNASDIVRIGKRAQQLRSQSGRPGLSQFRGPCSKPDAIAVKKHFAYQLRQSPSKDRLHDDIQEVLGFEKLKNAYDVWVVHLLEELHLTTNLLTWHPLLFPNDALTHPPLLTGLQRHENHLPICTSSK
mmetsp:Transcript_129704/g.361243  ORF Transcript_129704/g.361243 Transcript_129704/m.361243 type:complete len:245 (-) Transcript_129704:895-1629(-)